MEVTHPKKMKKIAQLYGGTTDLMNANNTSQSHLQSFYASCMNHGKKPRTKFIRRRRKAVEEISKSPKMGNRSAEKIYGVMGA